MPYVQDTTVFDIRLLLQFIKNRIPKNRTLSPLKAKDKMKT